MGKIYAVMYDLKSRKHDYSGMFDVLKSSIAWMHYIQDAWFIERDDTTDQIWKLIEPHINNNDFVFIVEINKNYHGALPKEAWHWLNEHLPI